MQYHNTTHNVLEMLLLVNARLSTHTKPTANTAPSTCALYNSAPCSRIKVHMSCGQFGAGLSLSRIHIITMVNFCGYRISVPVISLPRHKSTCARLCHGKKLRNENERRDVYTKFGHNQATPAETHGQTATTDRRDHLYRRVLSHVTQVTNNVTVFIWRSINISTNLLAHRNTPHPPNPLRCLASRYDTPYEPSRLQESVLEITWTKTIRGPTNDWTIQHVSVK